MSLTTIAQQFAVALCHRDVWPGVGFKAPPTMAQVQELLEKITELHIMPEGGFVALVQHADDETVADVHSGFLPAVRGKAALAFGKGVLQACKYKRLETWCAPEHKAARALALAAGFKQVGERLVLEKD